MGAGASLIRPAFAGLRPVRVQPSKRQSHVVGPDDDPSLPDVVGASHARGRRIPFRFMSALEKRPS